jgi:hypothetical protein
MRQKIFFFLYGAHQNKLKKIKIKNLFLFFSSSLGCQMHFMNEHLFKSGGTGVTCDHLNTCHIQYTKSLKD